MPITKVCPCCYQTVTQYTPEEIERNWQAMQLYYDLKFGMVWALPRVGFTDEIAAKKFKAAYPEYTVFFVVNRQINSV